MRQSRTTFAVFLVLSALLDSSSLAIAQPLEKTASDYLLEGKNLAKNKDFEGAYKAFRVAWQKKKSFDIAANLATVELERGNARNAAEYFAYWERNKQASPGASETAKWATVQKYFTEARAEVGSARIHLTADNGRSVEKADVLIDRARIERWVLDTGVVFVDPGPHSFVAQLPGCEDAVWQGNLQKGSDLDVPLTLKCRNELSASTLSSPGARLGAAEQDHPLSASASHRPSWVLVGFEIGIATVGLGVGIGSIIHSSNRRDDVDTKWTQLYDTGGQNACFDGANQASCDELASADKDALTFRNIAIAGFAVGSAATLATVITILGSSPSKGLQGQRSVKASVGVLPGGGTAVVRGSF